MVVLTGATVSAAVLAAVYVVQPFASHWLAREQEIALKAEQRARLSTLIDHEPTIRDAVHSLQSARARTSDRLLEGDTPAVAASSLQLLLNRYADESRVLLQRVDVAGDLDAAGDSLLSIPAQLTARGDIYGVVDLLFYLQHGEKLLVVDDFRISAPRTSSGRSQLVTLTLMLHGLHAPASADR